MGVLRNLPSFGTFHGIGHSSGCGPPSNKLRYDLERRNLALTLPRTLQSAILLRQEVIRRQSWKMLTKSTIITLVREYRPAGTCYGDGAEEL